MILSLLFACAPAGDGGNELNRPPAEEELVDSEALDLGCEGDVGIEAGMCAPDFALPSQNGEVVLSELASNRVVVIGAATW